MIRSLLFALVFVFTFLSPLPAQQNLTSTSSTVAQSFDPAQATQAWLNTFPADKRAKSDAYFEGGYWLLLWHFLWGTAVFIFLLQARVSARIRDLAAPLTRSKSLQVVLYTIAFLLITNVLSF